MANADNFISWEMSVFVTIPNAVVVFTSMYTVLEFSSAKCVSDKTQIQTGVGSKLGKWGNADFKTWLSTAYTMTLGWGQIWTQSLNNWSRYKYNNLEWLEQEGLHGADVKKWPADSVRSRDQQLLVSWNKRKNLDKNGVQFPK